MTRAFVAAATAAAVLASLAPATAVASPKGISGFVGGARGLDAGGLFTEPSDVAVYRGGDGAGVRKLFVVEADRRNARVQRLDAHGNFELMWGADVVRRGAPGDEGHGFEVCRAAVGDRATGCKAGRPGSRVGELRIPTAIAVNDQAGAVYVMDRGNRRVQQFRLDGRFVRAWGVSTGGLDSRTGGIAVSPAPPHHVFVGDEDNSRVLEFEADGTFVRGWGWGVATGGSAFETCDEEAECSAGRPRGGGWPLHLAVDGDGIVYSSEQATHSGIPRFDSEEADASTAALTPLAVDDVLGAGRTLGLAIDRETGSLIVPRDPFGPMVISEIRDPGASLEPGDGELAPALIAHGALPYLGSINGVDAAGGTIYMAKSTELNPNDPVTAFGACDAPDGPRDCNGLVVLGRAGPLAAVLSGAMTTSAKSATFTGAVASGGTSRYQLQLSTDGRRWRNAGRSRYTSGSGYSYVSVRVDGLDPGRLYSARLVATREEGAAAATQAISNSIVVALAESM